MTGLALFVLGYLTKALLGIAASKFLSYALSEFKYWPRVVHYLDMHPTRWSIHCHECTLHHPDRPVDTIT